ncbi:TPA: hypothetical protein HA251_06335 [Candidatus Woesearchaeota archaeon]|nr:hypothetical protein [Candidatus Woesearchaeota archaeon]
MKESQVREHISKGWIRAIVTFEIVGKPAKHVEDSLTGYIDNIKKDERIIVLRDERERSQKVDNGLYSAISEIEAIFKNLETLTWLAINFSPASIEIIAPDDFDIPSRDITNWLNDLLANLHEVSGTMRAHKNSADHLTVAVNQLIQNSVLLATRQGPKTAQEIGDAIGVGSEQLAPFLQHLREKGRIMENKGLYSFVPPGAVALKQQSMTIQNNTSPQTQKKDAKSAKKKKR